MYTNCTNEEFKCHGIHQCIPLSNKCDGFFDCPDHSDELPVTCPAETSCGRQQYLCLNGVCVNESLVCDSNNDCGDFSDELTCSEYVYWHPELKISHALFIAPRIIRVTYFGAYVYKQLSQFFFFFFAWLRSVSECHNRSNNMLQK